jgi:excisionase family DNA binding protein
MNGFELDPVGARANVIALPASGAPARVPEPTAGHRSDHQAPAVLDLCDAAALLGVGRTTAYKLVREQKWPTPVVRLGRLIKIPTQPLLDLLCCPSPAGGATSGIPAVDGVTVVRGG